MFNSGRSIPEQSQKTKKKKSASIFGCFGRRKSKSCSQIKRNSAPETPKRTKSPVKRGVLTTRSTNRIQPSSNLWKDESLASEHLKSAPNLRTLRPHMNAAQFAKRRNTVCKTAPKVRMKGSQRSNNIKDHHRRSHDSNREKNRAMAADSEHEDVLNRTAPAIGEQINLTLDESKRDLKASQELLSRRKFRYQKSREKRACTRSRTRQILTTDKSESIEIDARLGKNHRTNLSKTKPYHSGGKENKLSRKCVFSEQLEKTETPDYSDGRTDRKPAKVEGLKCKELKMISVGDQNRKTNLLREKLFDFGKDDSFRSLDRTPETLQTTLESTRQNSSASFFSDVQSLDVSAVGINNSKNVKTCYLAAGLQLLSSVPEIFNSVETGLDFADDTTDMEACIAYKAFVEERNMKMPKANKKPRNIARNDAVADVMFKLHPTRFVANREEDCMEFITTLLDTLDEELGEQLSPRPLFTGVQRGFYTKDNDEAGPSKWKQSYAEEFNSLSLHYTAEHDKIEDAFDFYTNQQRSLDQKSYHWYKFEVLPSLLLVQVLSYEHSTLLPQKAIRNVPVRPLLQFKKEWMYKPKANLIPETPNTSYGILIPTASEDTASMRGCPPLYQIRGVVYHTGHETITGHYVAAVFLPGSDGRRLCYYCDDGFVAVLSLQELNRRTTSYQVAVLLYANEDLNSFQ